MLNSLINQLPIKLNQEFYVDYITKKHTMDLFEMYSNENIAKYVSNKTHTSMKDSEEFMKVINMRMKQGNNIYLGIYSSEQNKLIGLIRFLEKEDPEVLTLGYALNEKYWGKAIVPLALSKLIDFIELDGIYSRLRATVRPENKQSQRCLEKLGFELKGSFQKQRVFGEEEAEAEAERLLYFKYLK